MERAEIEEQAVIVSKVFGVSVEEALKAISAVSIVTEQIIENITQIWSKLVEAVDTWTEHLFSDYEPVHPAYKTKTKHSYVMKSQVLNNKPLRVYARTNC